ncbi:YcnI family protein [Brevundimonas sp.]|uniref:YcnI family protein n=1 Tax=Brevundimonas sp. TaxID=1871086 RepID=UPI0035B29412
MRKTLLLAGLAGLIAGPALSHPVFAEKEAVAGAHWAGELRLGHGCDGSPTTSLRVEIPEALLVVRAQPKPGWTLDVEREPLAQPVAGEGGRMIVERVTAVTWTGRLTDDQFDVFGLAAKLPDAAGPLAFDVIQTCESGVVAWNEAAGADGSRPAHPPAMLNLIPAAPRAHH